MDVLDPHRIRFLLENRDFVKDIVCFDQTDSTNNEASRLALDGAPEGTVVLADAQLSGRGRQGRVWISPPGKNLYLSLILRPVGWPGHLGLLGLVAGLAVVDTLETGYGLGAGLKWPNDVMIAGRKVSGVLMETVGTGRGEDGPAVVLGIGVNINMGGSDFPEELAGRATSLRLQLGEETDRAVFTARLLHRIQHRYRTHSLAGVESVTSAWKARSVTMGNRIGVRTVKGRVFGKAVDITRDGFLVLQGDEGREHTIMAGDVEFG